MRVIDLWLSVKTTVSPLRALLPRFTVGQPPTGCLRHTSPFFSDVLRRSKAFSVHGCNLTAKCRLALNHWSSPCKQSSEGMIAGHCQLYSAGCSLPHIPSVQLRVFISVTAFLLHLWINYRITAFCIDCPFSLDVLPTIFCH